MMCEKNGKCYRKRCGGRLGKGGAGVFAKGMASRKMNNFVIPKA